MPRSGRDGTTGPDPASPEVRAVLQATRTRAEDRAADLQRAFDALVEATEGSNVDDEHDPEGTTIAFERSQLTAALDRAAVEVAEVDRALDRLAAGTYGRCEVCGEAVPAARLAARPTATRCLTCADRPA